MRDLIENAPARQLGRSPGAPDGTRVRQPRYFGICTRSSSWLAVSGWLAAAAARTRSGRRHATWRVFVATPAAARLGSELTPGGAERESAPGCRAVQTAASGLNVKATPLMQ